MPMSPRLLRPVAAGGFNPRTIAGLEGWWDAADSGSVTLDSGRVAEWRDKSGNARHAANATSGSTQPDYIAGGHNGNNLIRFAAASSQRLTVAGPDNFTFMSDGTEYYFAAVASFGTTANPNAFYALMANHSGSGIGFAIGYDDRASSSANDRLWMSISSVAAQVIGTNNADHNDFLPAQQKTLIEAVLDPDNVVASERAAFRSNGGSEVKANIQVGSPSASDPPQTTKFGILTNPNTGALQLPLQGDICEVLIYSGAVAAEAQTTIRKYLANKWGLTLA